MNQSQGGAIIKEWLVGPAPLVLTMTVDGKPLLNALQELARGLESRNIRERFDGLLLRELQDAVAGSGVGELTELADMPADGTGRLLVQMKPGRLLERGVAALRALRAEDEANGHGDLNGEG